MRVEPHAAGLGTSETHGRNSSTKAKAHGLVRQLQDDTFNGASLEKHRARFADRLSESSVDQATDSETIATSTDDETNVVENSDMQPSPIDEPAQPVDSLGSDGSTPDVSDVASQNVTLDGTVATQFYDSTFSLYPVSGAEQRLQWVA